MRKGARLREILAVLCTLVDARAGVVAG